jgi:SSS family solute:Na+ symporter
MHLQLLDWVIVALTLGICFIPALFFSRRSGKSTTEFFASGRSVPWWLAGLSMVATTFSADTPNLVTEIVRTKGVAGNWIWWAYVLTGVATVFFYARLWRRSRVLTDLEFYEVRYSGKAAEAVRGFRAIYLGLFFNCFILATVNLAACKIAAVLFGLSQWQTLLIVGVINVVFAAQSGLWGVMVIDMIQFFIKMTAVIAAAYFAVRLPEVGGLHGLVTKLSAPGPNGLHYLNFLPDFSNNWTLAISVFIMPIAVQWWATWYPGAEPGGGSYIAQRMLASKSEKDALGGVLFFNIAHYILRPWPWILVGLASIIVYPTIADIHHAFPNVAAGLLGDDIAYPAMLVRALPVGFIGLMVGGLIAAASSTILTHLNWGASYLIHDFYRRFMSRDQSEKHYVMAARIATVGLFVCAALVTLVLASAREAFDIILQIGAGTGLLYLLRWFWWRINAWCEVVAMVVSFGVSVVIFAINKMHGSWVTESVTTSLSQMYPGRPEVLSAKLAAMGPVQAWIPSEVALLLTVGVTTVCWLATAYIAPQTEMATLMAFYKKVKPAGPGWEPIRKAAGLTKEEAREAGDNLPLALVGWTAGCAAIWSGLFMVGKVLYGQVVWATALAAVFVASGSVLIWVVNRVWSGAEGRDIVG